jgi:large subunit ribosomal protein L13
MNTRTTKQSEIKRDWHLLDAKDQILGRLASQIAQTLIGKYKVYFVSHLDCGDYVVLLNTAKVKVTGRKASQKIYYRHSNYPGGLKEISFEKQMEKDPKQIIIQAVKNMLPKNKLRDQRMKRLKIFVDDNHPYQDKFINNK